MRWDDDDRARRATRDRVGDASKDGRGEISAPARTDDDECRVQLLARGNDAFRRSLELRRRVLELDQTLAELRESRVAITEAKEKSESLLLNILPAAIAEELIRTGVVKDGKLFAQAAAGIVADSIPESEWRETQNKVRAVLAAGGPA